MCKFLDIYLRSFFLVDRISKIIERHKTFTGNRFNEKFLCALEHRLIEFCHSECHQTGIAFTRS